MRARDFDTVMGVPGAATTAVMIVPKGPRKLDIGTRDCLLAGSIVALCTKFIAVARIVGVRKEAAPEVK